MLHPEKRVRDEEAAHFIAAKIDNQRSPFLVLAPPRIFMLVERRSVEVCETMRVFREVRRHPIDNDADALLVQRVDEVHEVIRGAKARSRRVVANSLIAP